MPAAACSISYSDAPGGSNVASNIAGFGFVGREPYSYHPADREALPVHRQFLLDHWTPRHQVRSGLQLHSTDRHLHRELRWRLQLQSAWTRQPGFRMSAREWRRRPVSRTFPFTGLQAFGLGIPSTLVQGIGNPKDSFSNKPLGLFWQDSFRVRSQSHISIWACATTSSFRPNWLQLSGLALAAYNQLGLQKGIQTDKNNIQPRVGMAWDPRGDGKSVIRASYGIFYDHPLLGLYFLGDASDGSKSGQLLFAGGAPCNPEPTQPARGSLNATNIFQGILTTSSCLPTIPGIPAEPAALRSVERGPVHQSELSEPGDVLPGGLPALSDIRRARDLFTPTRSRPT